MNRFLIKSTAFILFSCVIILLTTLSFKLNGYTDPFYLRFTSPKQTSLILGTSRAAQGLQPEVLNRNLYRTDIYNYSFTIAHSPFGPTYFNSIKSKLDEDSKNGVFIITVDPWSISGPAKNPNDYLNFKEKGLALGETRMVNLNPNFLYLLKSYEKSLYNLFLSDTSNPVFLHNDGWLEVDISMDSNLVKSRRTDKIEDYTSNMLPNYQYSSLRTEYLIRTIDLLKKHGKVYLVRLPVHPEMVNIEDLLMKDFNDKIVSISSKMNIPYKNFRTLAGRYNYVDGNHLFKNSGAKISEEIAQWIKSVNKL